MATKAERIAELQAEVGPGKEWSALEGPEELTAQAKGNFKVYRFTGLRKVKDQDGSERVARILHVHNEGQADEVAEWKNENPKDKPFLDAAVIVLNNRIGNVGNNMVGVDPESLRVSQLNSDLQTLIYHGIETDGNNNKVFKMALVIDRTTEQKSHLYLQELSSHPVNPP